MKEKNYNILFKRIHIMFKEIFLAIKNNKLNKNELIVIPPTTFQLGYTWGTLYLLINYIHIY